MTINELRDFTFESYYKRIVFVKESIYYLMKSLKKDLLLLATKWIEKIRAIMVLVMLMNIRILNWREKLVKWWKIITQQPETFENSNIFDIRLVIIEHLKTSCRLSKTKRQAEKVSQVDSGERSNSPLYSETKKEKKL